MSYSTQAALVIQKRESVVAQCVRITSIMAGAETSKQPKKRPLLLHGTFSSKDDLFDVAERLEHSPFGFGEFFIAYGVDIFSPNSVGHFGIGR